MEQKVISCDADSLREVNNLLDKGWIVKSMVTEMVSTSVSTGSNFSKESELRGKVVFLLEKTEVEKQVL